MSLKILTLNTAMLPEYPIFKEEPGKYERAKKLAALINKENYDIVCLQEVFSEEIREIFYSKLKTKLPFVRKKSGEDGLWVQDSGLFFASKYRFIGNTGFIEFEYGNTADTDTQAKKGIFFSRIDLGFAGYPGVQLYCLNTHLQSGRSHRDERRNQLREINNLMSDLFLKLPFPENGKVYADVLCIMLFGDLNVIGDSEEYEDMLNALSYPRDLFKKSNLSAVGFTWDGKSNSFIKDNDPDDHDQERLDYALAFDTAPVRHEDWRKTNLKNIKCLSCNVKMFKDSNGNDLSDHYGLETVIDL